MYGTILWTESARRFAGIALIVNALETVRDEGRLRDIIPLPALPGHAEKTILLMVCFCCCIVSCISGVYGNYGEGAYSPSILDIPSSAPPHTGRPL